MVKRIATAVKSCKTVRQTLLFLCLQAVAVAKVRFDANLDSKLIDDLRRCMREAYESVRIPGNESLPSHVNTNIILPGKRGHCTTVTQYCNPGNFFKRLIFIL